MSMHQVPDDGTKHLHVRDCPCNPKASKKRIGGMMRTVYAHQEQTPPPVAPPGLAAGPTYQVPPFPGGGVGEVYLPRARRAAGELVDQDDEQGPDCGHVLVDVDGEQQHHEIPDDDAQHAPTTECGCGPQRDTSGPHVVYVHADQGFDEQTEQLYREVFGA